MKPRLTYSRGCWRCMSVAAGLIVAGYGYTPTEAFNDWKDRI